MCRLIPACGSDTSSGGSGRFPWVRCVLSPSKLRATRTSHPLQPWCLSSGSLERRAQRAPCRTSGASLQPGPFKATAARDARCIRSRRSLRRRALPVPPPTIAVSFHHQVLGPMQLSTQKRSTRTKWRLVAVVVGVCVWGGGGRLGWWWWWWWCGHGVTQECLFVQAHACGELKRISASALAPSAELSSPHPTTPVPSEGTFQAYPGAKPTQPQVEEKD